MLSINDIILHEGSDEKAYTPNIPKRGVTWTQRSVLLRLIQFLTVSYDPAIENPVCVCIGVRNAEIITKIFPMFKFHFYFTDKVRIEEWGTINNELTDDDIKKFRNMKGQVYLFMNTWIEYNEPKSDVVRTGRELKTYEARKRKAIEEVNLRGLNEQKLWVKKIKPLFASVRFRPPYYQEDEEKEYEYLVGVPFFEVWADKSSTATSLYVTGYQKGEWDLQKYENQMFYFNLDVRDRSIVDDSISEELSNDFESAMEYLILKMYFEKIDSDDIDENVKLLSNKLTVYIDDSSLSKRRKKLREEKEVKISRPVRTRASGERTRKPVKRI